MLRTLLVNPVRATAKHWVTQVRRLNRGDRVGGVAAGTAPSSSIDRFALASLPGVCSSRKRQNTSANAPAPTTDQRARLPSIKPSRGNGMVLASAGVQ